MSPSPAKLAVDVPYSRPSTPRASLLQIGFCGLGVMGRLIARNLASHQPHDAPPILVYNRSIAKAHSLAAEMGKDKVVIAQSLEQLATDCDVIITCLANDTAVKSVYQQFSQALKDSRHTRPKIFVEMSTIFPTLAGELDILISGTHTHFITSPVFGAPPAADAAQLIIVMSGDVRFKKEVAYLFVPAIGRKVIDFGGNVERAPTLKLIGNSLILGTIELIAESMTLSEKSGVGAENLYSLMEEIMPSILCLGYGKKILEDQFDGTLGFPIENGIKDASHIRTLAADHNSPMPVIDVAHQHLLTARALHTAQGSDAKHAVLDWSAIVAGSRVAAGLDGLDSRKNVKVVKDD